MTEAGLFEQRIDWRSRVQAMRRRDDMPQPSYLLNTSPDKWQAVWKVEGFDLEQAERLMRLP